MPKVKYGLKKKEIFVTKSPSEPVIKMILQKKKLRKREKEKMIRKETKNRLNWHKRRDGIPPSRILSYFTKNERFLLS